MARDHLFVEERHRAHDQADQGPQSDWPKLGVLVAMNRPLKMLLILCAPVAALFLGAGIGWAWDICSQDLADPAVKVTVDRGRGSGVYIGRGYVLTAAHVVDGAKTVLVKAQRGNAVTGEVLWSNTDYDVALIRADLRGVRPAYLSCRDAAVGDAIEAIGNPRDLDFVHTYGQVAGGARPIEQFKRLTIASMLIVPGMSGGPVLNRAGEIVGLASAVRIERLGMMSGSMVPISYFVPSSVVCSLMGR